MSEVRDAREANNHGGTNIVRLSKSTLSPDEDLQCAVETSRSNYQSNNRETNDKLHPLYTLSAMFDIFHDNIYINEAVKKKKRKKYVFKYPCIL